MIVPHSPMIVMPKPHQKPTRAAVRASLERDRENLIQQIGALEYQIANINQYLAAQAAGLSEQANTP